MRGLTGYVELTKTHISIRIMGTVALNLTKPRRVANRKFQPF